MNKNTNTLSSLLDSQLDLIVGGSAAPDWKVKMDRDLAKNKVKDFSKEDKNLMGAAAAGVIGGAAAGAGGGPLGIMTGAIGGAAVGVGGYMVNAYITGGDKTKIPKTSDYGKHK